MKTLSVIIIGAGNRGQVYARHMKDSGFNVVAVAEPVKEQRDFIKNLYNLDDSACFERWEDILALPQMADIAVVATPDSMHYEPAVLAVEKGYNLLLEKPVAPSARECAHIANCAREKGVKVLVCHVLRYAPFFTEIKRLVTEGKLGKIVSIHHSECVGNIHHSHSYVRGNWGNSKKSSDMLLAKSCHDIDIMQWLMQSKCASVHSFGSLTYFKRENMPEGAPDYCIDGCPHGDKCYYNAVKLYLDDKNNSWFRNVCTKKVNPTDAEVEDALRNTQYGKCVFKCDNDVVDHQVVNIEFANGATASFNMSSFNEGGRYIRVMGTDGELYGDMEANVICYYDFATRTRETIDVSGQIVGRHGGGDAGIVKTLYRYIAEGIEDDVLSEIGISVDNHMAVFAAEKSRKEGIVVDVEEFKKQYLKN